MRQRCLGEIAVDAQPVAAGVAELSPSTMSSA
jgi:hypothetical protein